MVVMAEFGMSFQVESSSEEEGEVSEDEESLHEDGRRFEERNKIKKLSVLEQLKLCLSRNIQLQLNLEQLLRIVSIGLRKNKENQEKIGYIIQNHIRQPRASITAYIRQIKCKIPYFVDFYTETPPNNQDVLDRGVRPSDLYIGAAVWSYVDEKKLKLGVKRKNLELLAIPIQERMASPNVTVDELQIFEEEIQNLRFRDENELLQFSVSVDWVSLAYEQFDLDHSDFDCYIHYKNHLRPDINKSLWSQTEQVKLMDLVKKYDSTHWDLIAEELETGRTPLQCLQYYQQSINSQLLNKEWTIEENERLKEATRVYGVMNWGMGSRTSQQCITRYYASSNVADGARYGKWEADEMERLEKAIELFGSTGTVWNRISKYVGTRTSVQCRERYRNVIAGQHLVRPWTEGDIDQLLQYCREYLREGKAIKWVEISKKLNRRDDDCRHRWLYNCTTDEKIQLKCISIIQREYRKRFAKKRNSLSSESPLPLESEMTVDMLTEEGRQELEAYKKKVQVQKKSRRPRNQQSNNEQSSSNPTSTETVSPLTTVSTSPLTEMHEIISTTSSLTGSVSTPLTGSISTPLTGSVSTPLTGSVPTPLTGSISTPLTRSLTPLTGSVSTPLTGSISTPLTGSLTPLTGPVSTPLTGSVSTPLTGSVSTPLTGSVSTPLTGSVSTPQTSSASITGYSPIIIPLHLLFRNTLNSLPEDTARQLLSMFYTSLSLYREQQNELTSLTREVTNGVTGLSCNNLTVDQPVTDESDDEVNVDDESQDLSPSKTPLSVVLANTRSLLQSDEPAKKRAKLN